jgi:acetylornithine deacetylase/succinyl-diaminopimelate desuccinylase-like protein
MLNADEESSGTYGAEWMVERHWDRIGCEYVFNEGGRTSLKDGAVVMAGIQAAEKIYNDFTLWFRGESGHSSVPLPRNAIYDAGRMLARLEGYQAPLQVMPIQSAFFAGLAETPLAGEHRDAMRVVGGTDPAKASESAGELCRNPRYNALLRTTFVPTIVRSGIRANVLPPDVEINFNARVLPGERLDDLLHGLLVRLGLKDVEIAEVDGRERIEEWKRQNEARPPGERKTVALLVTDRGIDAPASPFETEGFAVLAAALKAMSFGAAVVPMMSTGATDSRFFRAKGVTAYGLSPCPVGEEEERTVHDHNERVRVSSVAFGLEWMHRAVVGLAR